MKKKRSEDKALKEAQEILVKVAKLANRFEKVVNNELTYPKRARVALCCGYFGIPLAERKKYGFITMIGEGIITKGVIKAMEDHSLCDSFIYNQVGRRMDEVKSAKTVDELRKQNRKRRQKGTEK